MLARKRDLHPSYNTLDMVTLIYSYATQGHLLCAVDADDNVVGVGAYYYGTPEQDFQDQSVALVDLAMIDRSYRGSRLFAQGMQHLIRTILEENPAVQELRLAALAENGYLCRLYSKFASSHRVREGAHGKEMIYSEKMSTLRDTLKKFDRL
jgi:hypothetical protein